MNEHFIIDPAALRHVVDTVGRWENYEAVDVVSVHRAPGNVKVDDPYIASGQGRQSTQVAQDNATGTNTAIERGFKESKQGETDIRWQRGVVRYDTIPILIENTAGASVIGGGGNLGEGDDPDETSWYSDTGGAQYFFGTEIFGTGYGAAAMVELTDVVNLRWKGLSLRGDGTDPALHGIAIGKAVGGLGPSTHYYEQVSIQNCDHGVNVGRCVISGSTGSVNGTTFDDAAVSNWTNTTVNTTEHKVHITAVNSGDAVIGQYDIAALAAGNLTLGSSASTGVSSVVYHIGPPQYDHTVGYVVSNCSEIVMMQPMMKGCTYGIVTSNGQNVNFVMMQPQFATGIAYKIFGGGGMTMIQPVTFDTTAVVEATGGGSNTGVFLSLGGRYDASGSVNTKLWNGTDDFFNVGVFFGGGFVYNAGVPSGARVTLQPNHFVSVYHHHNGSDSGGSKPIFESAATGAKIMGCYAVWLIPESYRSFSRSDNIGTWHTNGDWVVRDCVDNTNSVRVRDAEYPRLNGRSSTHAYEREYDFESVGDGMAGLIATTTGDATVTAVAPWDQFTVGVAALDTGTGATNAAAILTHTAALAFTGGPWRLEIRARLMQLSVVSGGNPDPGGVTTPYGGTSGIAGGDATTNDADELFTVRIGFLDTTTGEPTDGAYWRYSAANSGRWECVTRDATVETAVDAGIALTNAVAAGDQDPHMFEVKVNPLGTSVLFYLDGDLAATITTNLPDATDYTGYGMTITKTAGTSNRYAHKDFVRVENTFSTPRGVTHSK